MLKRSLSLSYPIYPVRNNAPLLCSGVTHFRIIPAGFNAPLEFLTGFTIEYPRIRKKWVENASR
jgi:hypothetical protein